MFLEATHNIRRQLLVVGIALIVAPVTVLGVAGWAILHRIEQATVSEAARPSSTNLTHLTQSAVDISRSYYQDSLDRLKRGQSILEAAGQVQLDETQPVTWQAKNEETGEVSSVQLPLMKIGEFKLEPVNDFGREAPVVDEITKVEGTPATIYQRMGAGGDMLRICSSLKSETGTRAIGSYIPASGAGEPARALNEVLGGRTHFGKEVLANVSYVTAYQPLKDSKGNLSGMLYTAFPEEQIQSKVKALSASHNIELGELFILEAAGERRGTVLVMGNRAVEGKDLWNEKDPVGRPYVQELCARALHLSDGEVAEYKYQRVDRAGGIPKLMLARFAYVPELDWVVGFTQPAADSLAAGSPLALMTSWAMWFLLGVGIVGAGTGVRIWIEFADDLARFLHTLLRPLRREAKQLTDAAAMMSKEAARRVEAKVAAPKQTAGVTGGLPAATAEILARAAKTIDEIRSALQHTDAASASLANIAGAIDQITFASNLVMVNAAIQASTSPANSDSMAGVADQLRALTEQCRKAARVTEAEIEQTRAELQSGNSEVLQLVHDLQRDGQKQQSAGPGPNDEGSLVLHKQAEALMRLAEGIDRSVEGIAADLGIDSAKQRAI